MKAAHEAQPTQQVPDTPRSLFDYKGKLSASPLKISSSTFYKPFETFQEPRGTCNTATNIQLRWQLQTIPPPTQCSSEAFAESCGANSPSMLILLNPLW
jgi:hypothetical protein